MVKLPATTPFLFKTTFFAATFALLIQAGSTALAQTPGSLDGTFQPPGLSSDVNAVLVQPDGKVVVGGLFRTAGGASHPHVVRLNSDGTVDAAFDPLGATGKTSGSVNTVLRQPDGKIIAVGRFTRTDDNALRNNVARFNADGSLDAGFDPAVPFDGFGAALQPDGKLLVAGEIFQTSPTIAYYLHIIRLNPDGTTDGSFNFTPVPGAGSTTVALAVQPDGKIVLGSIFAKIGGATRTNIARLNADGSLDAGFDTGAGVTSSRHTAWVQAIVLQSDGTMFIGGTFDKVNGAARGNVARLTATGALDTTYTPALNLNNAVFALAQQADGKLFVGGAFNQDLTSQRALPNLIRLKTDGTLDTAFTAARSGLGAEVHGLALQSDGKLIVGGTDQDYVFRLNGDPAAPHPAFFSGETLVGNGVYYLQFPSGNPFGYYSYLADPKYIYHFDLGYEYLFDAADGKSGVYFYDFASSGFFYTSPGFPFPYLYDFSLNSVVYYYPDPSNPVRYNTNGVRYFYVFSTGQIISK